MLPTVGAPFGGMEGGRRKTRRSGMSVKALKRALKKAGLKTTGKKAALTKRAKKAHLMRGGAFDQGDTAEAAEGTAEAALGAQPEFEPDQNGQGRRRRRNGRSRRGGMWPY
jgi:hypothetical protein